MGIVFCMLMGLLMSIAPIADNDWFWHYVVGGNVFKTRAIPTHELFSWFGNKAWVAHEWLNEAIIYKLGPVGSILMMLLIFIGLYLLMAKMLRLNWKKLFDFKLLFFLIMCVFFRVTGPRPYIISLLFFAYLIYVLFSYVDDEKKNSKLVWTLPALQILWVNLHGGSSSMIYIFLIGTLMCHYFLNIVPIKSERFTDDILSKKQTKTLWILLALTLVCTCINPFGYKMLLYPFTNMADTSMTSYILEWQSPSFHGLLGIYIFIMVAFPLFNLILQKKNMKLHEIAFQLLLLFMALKSQRFIGMYGIYSTWNIGKYFFVTDDMYEAIRKPFKKFEKVITYGFVTLLILMIGLVGYKQLNSLRVTGIVDNDGYYSDAAIKEVIKLKPERLYNDYGQGGYLLYKLDEFGAIDDVKIFAYGLGDVFSKDILPDSSNLARLKTNPRAIIEKYDFDYILTSVTYPLHYFLDECDDYELIFSDKSSFIYKKVNNA